MSVIKIAMFCCDFLCFFSKRYSIGEVLKRIFFRNPGIARLVALERDVKPRNMNFAKVEKRGGGGVYTDKYGMFPLPL